MGTVVSEDLKTQQESTVGHHLMVQGVGRAGANGFVKGRDLYGDKALGTGLEAEREKRLIVQQDERKVLIDPPKVLPVTFDSGLLEITQGGTYTLEHGLYRAPDLVRTILVCTVANNGYEIGEEVEVFGAVYDRATGADVNQGVSVAVGNTTLIVQLGSYPNFTMAFHSRAASPVGAGVVIGANVDRWKLRVRAYLIGE